MIFDNLIKQKLISPGTWIGIKNGDRAVIKRLSVIKITSDSEVLAVDYSNNTTVRLNTSVIAEIDGMTVGRFLQQADLNGDGEKITGIKRRGRRPKNRSL